MGEVRDSTIFIDVAEGNVFTGLLDQFEQELQNSTGNLETEGTNEEINDKFICDGEIKADLKIDEKTDENIGTNLNLNTKTTTLFDTSAKKQNDRIRCPECQRYTAENEEKMIRHIRKVHRGENPFVCYMCDYSTYNKILFEEHVRIHQGIKPYKCSFCPHKSVSKKNLKKHELIHRPDYPLKCTLCSHIARHKKGLAFHIKKFHSNAEDSMVCFKCNEVFYSPIQLSKHINSEKKCEDCDYAVCSTSLMENHRESKHGKTKGTKKYMQTNKRVDLFKCAICDWSSYIKSRILLHLIHHPNQTVDESVIDISILKKHGIM